MFVSKNLKKGRHAFGLHHGERIEGRTYQNGAQTDQKTFRNPPQKKIFQQMLKSADLYRVGDSFCSQQMQQIIKKTSQTERWKQVKKEPEM